MTAPPAGPVVRFGVDGELGQMQVWSVLQAFEGGFDLLRRTAHRVLGDRADDLIWRLDGLREGSAMTLVRAEAPPTVTLPELREVLETYRDDLADPARRLPDDDVPVLRRVLTHLQQSGSGSLIAQLDHLPDSARVVVEPARTLAALESPRTTRFVIGSVVGRLDSLKVHRRLEASLWTEVPGRRVAVVFAEAAYDAVHSAMRKRVELFGEVQEDADGRPVQVRLTDPGDVEVLPDDRQLPTLSSIFGTLPDMRRDHDLGDRWDGPRELERG